MSRRETVTTVFAGHTLSDSLSSPEVSGLLDRLFTAADHGDPELLAQIQKQADDRFAGNRYAPELTPLFDQAYLPVPPEVGRFLYVLTRASRPRLVLEIGTSYGVSAVHFACALKDNGQGRLISTELSRKKVETARQNLERLQLGHLVEIRCGDAFDTVKKLDAPTDVLFLDGWKDSYLPLLKVLEPSLASGSLVIADDIKLFPERLAAYLGYVRDPRNGYRSTEINIGDGVELSVRT